VAFFTIYGGQQCRKNGVEADASGAFALWGAHFASMVIGSITSRSWQLGATGLITGDVRQVRERCGYPRCGILRIDASQPRCSLSQTLLRVFIQIITSYLTYLARFTP
jgi:hypothetical protein